MRLEFEPNVTAFPLTENKEFQSANDSIATDFDLLLKDGVAAAQNGERERARVLLIQATDLHPKSEDAWMWLASISDYPEELLAFLNHVLEINPENKRAVEWRSATNSLLAKTFVQRATLAHEEGDTELAEKCLEQSLVHDERCESSWMLKARIAGNDDQKLEFLGKALEINRDNQDAQDQIKSINQSRSDAAFKQAKDAAAAGDQAKAVSILDEFLLNSPQSVEAWTLKSHLSVSLAEKIGALQRALEIDPENAAAMSGLSFLTLTFGAANDSVEQNDAEIAEPAEPGLESEFAHLHDHPAEPSTEAVPENDVVADETPAELAQISDPDHFVEPMETVEETTPHLDADDKPERVENTDEFSFESLDKEPESQHELEAFDTPEPTGQTRDVEPEMPAVETAVAAEEPGNESAAFDTAEFGDEVQQFEDSYHYVKTDSDLSAEISTSTDSATDTAHDYTDAGFVAQFGSGSSLFEDDPTDMEFAPAFDYNTESLDGEPEGYPYDPWKTRVGNIDSWLDQDVTSGMAESENVARDEAESISARAAEDMFGPIPADVDADRVTVDSISPFAERVESSESHEFENDASVADDDIAVQKMPLAVGQISFDEPTAESEPDSEAVEFPIEEKAETVTCESCTAPNESNAVNCVACLGPLAGSVNEPVSDHSDVEFSFTEPVAEPVLEHPNVHTACPFCRSQNDAQAFECSSCHATLTLSDIESLLSNSRADRNVVQQSVTEMEAEWNLREFDEQELTDLAVGHFNLGNAEAGTKYLQEVSRLNPNNVILTGQLNTIAIRLEEIRRQDETHEAQPKGKTILVVDDSPTVRKLISGKLEKSGHNVICTIDGVEALARVSEMMPDLILLDIAMPRMDGYEVCKQIRSNPTARNLPVVMISGKDGFFDKVRGRMAGCTGYVTKPFGPETLMKALETYLLPDDVVTN